MGVRPETNGACRCHNFILDLGNFDALSTKIWLRKEMYDWKKEGEASFRFNVYSPFGVRNIFRGSLGALAYHRPVYIYHPSARQMRFGTKIWVSRRYGKSSSNLIRYFKCISIFLSVLIFSSYDSFFSLLKLFFPKTSYTYLPQKVMTSDKRGLVNHDARCMMTKTVVGSTWCRIWLCYENDRCNLRGTKLNNDSDIHDYTPTSLITQGASIVAWPRNSIRRTSWPTGRSSSFLWSTSDTWELARRQWI